MRKVIIFLFVLCLFSPSAFASYRSFSLKNGLKYYIEEDHRLGIVNITVLYRVGSYCEYNSITGIAHMLEHMNFRGSKHFKDGYLDRLSEEFGGVNNAQTSFDYTMYFITIKKSAYKKALAAYADMMSNLDLNDKRFQKERNVVYQERLWRIDNSASGFLYYSLHNLAYLASAYRWTPIGYAYDIKHYDLGDLRRFYKKYYLPNNAIIVISGDIDTDSAKKAVEKYFSNKKPADIECRITKEPQQIGRRIMYIKKPSSMKKLAMGFKIDNAKSRFTPELDLISYMLFYMKSSMADKDLIRDKHILSSISGGNEERIHDKGLFEIFADINKNISFNRARDAIENELNKIKSGDFNIDTLNAAKSKAISDYYFSQETLSEKNSSFAFYAAFDMRKYYENYPSIIKKITKRDIMAAANKYFVKDRESDCFLIPQKGKIVSNAQYKGGIR